MTRIIPALSEIAAGYDAVFCDLWGCLHNGRAPFPAAVAALAAYKAQGGIVLLLTNAPRPRAAVERQLDQLGVPRDIRDEIATSGDAAQYALMTGAVGRKVWHLGPEKDNSFFTDLAEDVPRTPGVEKVALAEAEGIVCTGPFDDLTDVPEDYRARFLLAKTRGLPMLCANPDIAVDYGDRRIWCAGALAALYEEMGGRALYFGKPHPPIYDLARRRLAQVAGREIEADRILAIGDGPGTDVKGAQGEGLDTLFITGGLAAARFGPDPAQPDPARLQAFLDAEGLAPRYAMGHLA
ncbi:MAG: TIGR01459 family HAD-type hydrolase [Gemmobacter sp.]